MLCGSGVKEDVACTDELGEATGVTTSVGMELN